MENLSFQAPAFAGLGVLGCEVGLADAGQVEARIGQGIDHAGAILDQTHRYLIEDPRMQLVAAMSAGRGLDGVAHLLGALQLHRIGPAVALVHQVAQAVKGVLIAGWRDVEAAPCGQLEARAAEMQLDAAFVAVTNPEHVVLLAVQTGKGQLLEGDHHLGLLRLAGRVLGGKADHARAVGPLVAAGVDQRLGAGRIAAQHLGQGLARHHQGLATGVADQVTIAVIGQHALGHEIADRPRTRALAVGEELDQHRRAASTIWAS
ncbi:hypothetical protein [Pukyongiella litopenaei]|uniref:hypothetical protein n=1 Tax=Pukyongiella litopenaei TaxID=2605946 RepID=UPI003CC7E643